MTKHGALLIALIVAACGKQDETPPPPPKYGQGPSPAEILRLPKERVSVTLLGHPVSVEVPVSMKRNALHEDVTVFEGFDSFYLTVEAIAFSPPFAPPHDEAFATQIATLNERSGWKASKPQMLDDGVMVSWTDPERRTLRVLVVKETRSETRSWSVSCNAHWDDREPLPAFERIKSWSENLCRSMKL